MRLCHFNYRRIPNFGNRISVDFTWSFDDVVPMNQRPFLASQLAYAFQSPDVKLDIRGIFGEEKKALFKFPRTASRVKVAFYNSRMEPPQYTNFGKSRYHIVIYHFFTVSAPNSDLSCD